MISLSVSPNSRPDFFALVFPPVWFLKIEILLPAMVRIARADTGANVPRLKHPITDAVTSRFQSQFDGKTGRSTGQNTKASFIISRGILFACSTERLFSRSGHTVQR